MSKRPKDPTSCSRRAFLGAGAAFLAFPGFAAHGKPRLRVGVISDLHLETHDCGGLVSVPNFVQVLNHFDELKADAVLACGDLTDFGTERMLLDMGTVWRQVFPNDRRVDGEPIVKLFHFGDHDAGGYAHKWDWARAHCAKPDEELKHPISEADVPALWRKAFDEEWQPVMTKTVKGYAFVLANHPPHNAETHDGQFIPGAAEAVASVKPESGKVFFYSQHRGVPDTVHGKEQRGLGGPEIRKALEKRPDCFVFTGHAHANCADEMSLWQGEFTAVAVPSLSYCCTRPGRENSHRPDVKGRTVVQDRDGIWKSGQYLFMTVYDDCITIARHDVTNRAKVGPDWVIPLPLPDGSCTFAARAKRSRAPQFAKGAKVTVECGVVAKDREGRTRTCVKVSFSPAHATAKTPRAFDYEVRVGDVVRRVFSANSFWADEKDVKPAYCLIDRTELPGKLDGLKVSVRPADSFGNHGAAIEATIHTDKESER